VRCQLTVDHGPFALAWPYINAIMRANHSSTSHENIAMPKLAFAQRTASTSPQALKRKSAGKRKAKAVLDRPSLPPGWNTSDDHEITLRRWRGRTEILSVKALEPDHPYFGTFRAQSASGGSYEVEIRSLNAFANSCGCIDYRVNGLGTCKHVEGTIEAMARGRTKSFRAAKETGSPRVEVFLDRRASCVPAIMWPAEEPGRNFKPVRDWLAPFLAPDGTLTHSPEQIESLIAAWDAAYGPVGKDGYPRPVWDRMTGKIDRDVALYMRDNGYDLRYNLEKNWSRIGADLVGKIHVYCGDMDNYYLNLAVYHLEDFLKSTDNPRAEAVFEYGRPMKPHGWQPFTNAELIRMMAARINKTLPGNVATK